MDRFMEPCLLLLIAEKPAYGYELMSRLQDFGFGDDQDPGMVYRNLRRLENQGAIESQWDTSGSGPARRLYEITPDGSGYLRTWGQILTRNSERIHIFLQRFKTLKEELV